jgi:hypothetical protein
MYVVGGGSTLVEFNLVVYEVVEKYVPDSAVYGTGTILVALYSMPTTMPLAWLHFMSK